MQAAIKAVSYFLPDAVVTNAELAREFPEWSVGKIEQKTGIVERHIAAPDETASDLVVRAAEKLFAGGLCSPDEVDFILFCTQSPDYVLPTTACSIQNRLGVPTTAGALDYNLGCSGFVYGLGLAKGLIETDQARRVLLLTGETYSRYINPCDKSVRTLFGDAGAATIVEGVDRLERMVGPFVYGTDGSGAENLIVRTGGARNLRTSESSAIVADEKGNARSEDDLFMNGAEIFNFTLRTIPDAVNTLLAKAGISLEDVDAFVFHQANEYMVEHLRKKMSIPAEKSVLAMRYCGNTVSSTIPIAIADGLEKGLIKAGQQLALVGFGVGYSWGAAMVRLA